MNQPFCFYLYVAICCFWFIRSVLPLLPKLVVPFNCPDFSWFLNNSIYSIVHLSHAHNILTDICISLCDDDPLVTEYFESHQHTNILIQQFEPFHLKSSFWLPVRCQSNDSPPMKFPANIIFIQSFQISGLSGQLNVFLTLHFICSRFCPPPLVWNIIKNNVRYTLASFDFWFSFWWGRCFSFWSSTKKCAREIQTWLACHYFHRNTQLFLVFDSTKRRISDMWLMSVDTCWN